MVSYALMVLFAGSGALRDASGNLTDLLIVNGTVLDYSGLGSCVMNDTCKYGLHNSYSVRYFIRTVIRYVIKQGVTEMLSDSQNKTSAE